MLSWEWPGSAAKALGHSHATCRSGLALNYFYYAYRKRNSFSWKRRHSQSGSLENETIASIVKILESSLGFTAASPTVAKLGKGLPCSTRVRVHSSCSAHIALRRARARARVATKAPFLRRKSLFLSN